MNEAFARQVFDVEFRYIDRLRGLNPSQSTLDDLDRQEAELITSVPPAVQRLAAEAWEEGASSALTYVGWGEGSDTLMDSNPYRSAK